MRAVGTSIENVFPSIYLFIPPPLTHPTVGGGSCLWINPLFARWTPFTRTPVWRALLRLQRRPIHGHAHRAPGPYRCTGLVGHTAVVHQAPVQEGEAAVTARYGYDRDKGFWSGMMTDINPATDHNTALGSQIKRGKWNRGTEDNYGSLEIDLVDRYEYQVEYKYTKFIVIWFLVCIEMFAFIYHD